MLPTIDLSLPEDQIIQSLHEACLEYGFFYLRNHGISNSLIKRVLSGAKQLFDLPEQEKKEMNAVNSPYFRGYTPFNEEKLDDNNQVIGDTKEGFYLGAEPREHEKPGLFYGPNQWPQEKSLPGWKALMEEYQQACTAVCMKLVELLGKAVTLCANDNDKFEDFDFTPFFSNPLRVLRLLHYNKTTSSIKDGIFGCGAHTDYGMLTLLLTDDVPALQIFPRRSEQKDEKVAKDDPNWMTVPPMEGAFIVNLGDLLQRWTNDMYKSTLHRVVNLSNKERYSVPFFFAPDFNCKVECIPATCSDKERLYSPVISGKHLRGRYVAAHRDISKQLL